MVLYCFGYGTSWLWLGSQFSFRDILSLPLLSEHHCGLGRNGWDTWDEHASRSKSINRISLPDSSDRRSRPRLVPADPVCTESQLFWTGSAADRLSIAHSTSPEFNLRNKHGLTYGWRRALKNNRARAPHRATSRDVQSCNGQPHPADRRGFRFALGPPARSNPELCWRNLRRFTCGCALLLVPR